MDLIKDNKKHNNYSKQGSTSHLNRFYFNTLPPKLCDVKNNSNTIKIYNFIQLCLYCFSKYPNQKCPACCI